MPTNAFISYSHADEKALERLHKHLATMRRQGELDAWFDREILPGTKFDEEIRARLEASSIFLALVSPDYLASEYCYEKELEHALHLAEAGKIRIVPIILEPCDWMSSPFHQFIALPKDGLPASQWKNQDIAFLDVVNGLRRLLKAAEDARPDETGNQVEQKLSTGRRPRVKRDFDAIEKADFADKAYGTIKEYFRASCEELTSIGDDLRARFEPMGDTSFSCTIVNRAKRDSGEAHITVHNMKQGRFFGDISYVYQRYAEKNTSNGSITVGADEYNLFLTWHNLQAYGWKEAKYSPDQVAEQLWNEFVKRAGIEYE
jgi:hypothetical protein